MSTTKTLAENLLALVPPMAPDTPEQYAARRRADARPWTAAEKAGPEADFASREGYLAAVHHERKAERWQDDGREEEAARRGVDVAVVDGESAARREARVVADIDQYAAAYAARLAEYERKAAEYDAAREAAHAALPECLRDSGRAKAETHCKTYLRRRASLLRQIRAGAATPGAAESFAAQYGERLA